MHSNKKQLIPEKTESTAFSGINFYVEKRKEKCGSVRKMITAYIK